MNINVGPGLPATLKQDLVELLKNDGYTSIEQVIGIAHKGKIDDVEVETILAAAVL
jgi:dihydroorotate dehydrogenase